MLRKSAAVMYVWAALVAIPLASCNGDTATNPDPPATAGLPTVTIGNQVWMVENLKVTHFADGTPIDHVVQDDWDGYPFDAYCDYLDNPDWSDRLGRLYNWAIPNTGATDEFGFGALPGGYRGADGHQSSVELAGYYWTSSIYYGQVFEFDAYFRIFGYNRTDIYRGHIPKGTGMSVRCIKESK